MSMRKSREILNTSRKAIMSAVCMAEILLIPGGLTACSANNSSATDQITLEKAEEVALADAGVTMSDITSIKTRSDTTNGIYDIEFYADDVKYEYEIAAETGIVHSRSKETPANQENDPDETRQDMIQADETQSDTIPASSGSRQDTDLLNTTGQNMPQSGSTQQDTPRLGSAQQNTPQPNETQPTPDAKGQISLNDAKKAALADAGLSSPDVTYTKAKLDYEYGIAVYDIEFHTSTMDYEYEIHAATGAVHSKDVETHHTRTGHGDHAQTPGSYIGDDSARSIALDHAGISASDVTRLRSELDTDDGQAVYEVEFYKDGREYEYKIDASDGTILKYETD